MPGLVAKPVRRHAKLLNRCRDPCNEKIDLCLACGMISLQACSECKVRIRILEGGASSQIEKNLTVEPSTRRQQPNGKLETETIAAQDPAKNQKFDSSHGQAPLKALESLVHAQSWGPRPLHTWPLLRTRTGPSHARGGCFELEGSRWLNASARRPTHSSPPGNN